MTLNEVKLSVKPLPISYNYIFALGLKLVESWQTLSDQNYNDVNWFAV